MHTGETRQARKRGGEGMNNIEEIIFAPVSDEDYARRMRRIREAIKFQEKKYGKVARTIAVQNFKHMFTKESE